MNLKIYDGNETTTIKLKLFDNKDSITLCSVDDYGEIKNSGSILSIDKYGYLTLHNYVDNTLGLKLNKNNQIIERD